MPGLHVLLFAPEIAGNTGNIIRLCANTGSRLHLIEPITFELDDVRLRRAGLDYHEYADVQVHQSLQACRDALDQPRIFAFSARATRSFAEPDYRDGDALLFGPESTGLSDPILAGLPAELLVKIPKRPETRSLNLSNAVAVAVYEGLRQLDYPLG
ncbi:MAG: tRNA (cytidine(34)-2'-O)-methyltransferase [Actinobacteria bacterium]|nr:tRNA (cytidine(34)-2'-O)-methyltransferase [Actinomycetota bacterium]